MADPRTLRDANGKRPYDIARMLQHCRLESLLNPETPLSQAVAVQPRASRMQGCTPLTVLAGKAVQVCYSRKCALQKWQFLEVPAWTWHLSKIAACHPGCTQLNQLPFKLLARCQQAKFYR